jgi:hypothetical protein
MMEKNHALEHLDLTCNELGDEAGKVRRGCLLHKVCVCVYFE